MGLKLWTKVGEPDVLAAKYGRKLLLQKFLTPKGEEVAELTTLGFTLKAFVYLASSRLETISNIAFEALEDLRK